MLGILDVALSFLYSHMPSAQLQGSALSKDLSSCGG